MSEKTLEPQFLGKILIDRKIIDQKQLKHALEAQKELGKFLGATLIELGYAEEHDIVAALVVQCHVPYINIERYQIDPSVIQLVPADIARKYHVIPLERVNDVLSIAMSDPLDMEAQIELERVTKCQLTLFLSSLSEIEKAIQQWYSGNKKSKDQGESKS